MSDLANNRRSVSGASLTTALEYALRACPSPDDNEKLAHIIFHAQGFIAASDARRMHVALMPAGTLKTIAATKSSVKGLQRLLEYATGESANCFVLLDGATITVEYGSRSIEHELQPVNVGPIPDDWRPPVAPDAVSGASHPAEFQPEHVRDAMRWGGVAVGAIERCPSDKSPKRYDLVSDGAPVAYAILLPKGRRAVLLGDKQGGLFDGKARKNLGQHALALQFEQLALDFKADDMVGIPNPDEFVVFGCEKHGVPDMKPCGVCTTEAMAKERERLKAEAGGEKKGKKGKDDGAAPNSGAEAPPPAPGKKAASAADPASDVGGAVSLAEREKRVDAMLKGIDAKKAKKLVNVGPCIHKTPKGEPCDACTAIAVEKFHNEQAA